MQTEIDPAYLAKSKPLAKALTPLARHSKCNARHFSPKRSHRMLQALGCYNGTAEEHNVIFDAVEQKTCGDCWEKSEERRKSDVGQSYEEWMQDFEPAKIEPLDERDVPAEHVHIIKAEGDADDIPDRLHIIRRE